MKYTTFLLIVLEISLAGISAVAQTAAPPAGQPSPAAGAPAAAKPPAPRPAAPKPAVAKKPASQVDNVIELVKGGMTDAFIIKYLQKNNKPADLTPADMVKLKAAGVSETVIGAMMDPASASVAAAAPVETAPPAPVADVAPVAPVPPPAPVLVGDWRGTLVTPKMRVPVAYHLAAAGAGTLDVPSQKLAGTPVQYFANGTQVTITVPLTQSTIVATVEGSQMTGTYTQGGDNIPVTLILNGPMEEAAPAKPARVVAAGDWKSAISAALEDKYPLTGATADATDVVTPGAVVALKKSGLLMSRAGALVNANTYKNGAIAQGFFGTLQKTSRDGSARTFVKGEKFWVIGIDVKDDGVTLKFLSDPLPDSRYEGALKFPIARNTTATPEQILAQVGEVLAVIPTSAAPPQAPQQAPRQMDPIPPPPPPAPAPRQMDPIPAPAPPPPTLSVGQTKEQAIAAMGQPDKIATVGTKQILYFKNLKVTLVSGKITVSE